MRIPLVTCVGYGQTELAAFDHALVQAGVGDYNLIRLSSVIPRHAEVLPGHPYVPPEGPAFAPHGQRLYVVYAEQRSSVPGSWAGAAIGWAVADDGRGWFVEHEGVASSRAKVEHLLATQVEASLHDLCARRDVGPLKFEIAASCGQVEDQPLCALALAAYAAEDWPS